MQCLFCWINVGFLPVSSYLLLTIFLFYAVQFEDDCIILYWMIFIGVKVSASVVGDYPFKKSQLLPIWLFLQWWSIARRKRYRTRIRDREYTWPRAINKNLQRHARLLTLIGKFHLHGKLPQSSLVYFLTSKYTSYVLPHKIRWFYIHSVCLTLIAEHKCQCIEHYLRDAEWKLALFRDK